VEKETLAVSENFNFLPPSTF